jgi:hypothetical protein
MVGGDIMTEFRKVQTISIKIGSRHETYALVLTTAPPDEYSRGAFTIKEKLGKNFKDPQRFVLVPLNKLPRFEGRCRDRGYRCLPQVEGEYERKMIEGRLWTRLIRLAGPKDWP